MKLELPIQLLYESYVKRREGLGTYWCHKPMVLRTVQGGVYLRYKINKGLYKCEFIGKEHVKVYDSYVGTVFSKVYFDLHFKKCGMFNMYFYKMLKFFQS